MCWSIDAYTANMTCTSTWMETQEPNIKSKKTANKLKTPPQTENNKQKPSVFRNVKCGSSGESKDLEFHRKGNQCWS